MSCYHPLAAVQNLSTKVLCFNMKKFDSIPHSDRKELLLPCGRCVGCRMKYAQDWACRCVHESRLHTSNCFVTLTYNNDHCPADMSLDKSHFQKFMKRLRKRFTGIPIRYYHCGEYGETTNRPHYHALLFGIDFHDKVYFKRSGKCVLYTSAILDSLWGKGFCTIGAVTPQSAGYCARYSMKKIVGAAASDHYTRVLPDGTVTKVLPEYSTMSRRPGIGRAFYEKFKSDMFPHGMCVVNSREVRVPRYYDTLFEVDDPVAYEELKESRKAYVLAKQELDNLGLTFFDIIRRLVVKEYCRAQMLSKLSGAFRGSIAFSVDDSLLRERHLFEVFKRE